MASEVRASEIGEFYVSQLKLCNRKRHAYQVKHRPNTHLRGRPKKQLKKKRQINAS